MENKMEEKTVVEGQEVVKEEKERGASLVEYALLVALIAVVAIVALQTLGTQVSTNFSEVRYSLDQQGGTVVAN